MRCLNCDVEMQVGKADYQFTESGLSNVVLRDLEIRRCPRCGEQEAILAGLETIHRTIANELVAKPGRLAPEEARFLRKYLELSGTDLATQMSVAPETVSRWENGAQDMGVVADKLLRMMVRSLSAKELRAVAIGDSTPLRIEISPVTLDYQVARLSFPLGTTASADTDVKPEQTTDVARSSVRVANDNLALVA